MSYDPRRAALLALCTLVVLFAASLFPATGFGTAPEPLVGAPTSGDTGADSGGDGAAFDPRGGTERATTAAETADRSNRPTATPSSETSTHTATATTTTAAAVDDPNRDDGIRVGGLLGIALSAGLLIGCGFVLRILGYRRREWWLAHPKLPDLPPARIREGLQLLPRATMHFALETSAAVPGLLDRLGVAASEVGDATGAILSEAARSTGRVLIGVPAAFGRGLSVTGRGLGAALGGLPRVLAGLGGGLTTRNWPRSTRRDAGTRSDSAVPDGESADEGWSDPESVEEAWRGLTELVRVRNRRAATPTDYARAAIDRGLPEGPVRRLTAAFQEIRYGGESSTDERVSDARTALAALRRAIDGGDDS